MELLYRYIVSKTKFKTISHNIIISFPIGVPNYNRKFLLCFCFKAIIWKMEKFINFLVFTDDFQLVTGFNLEEYFY